ncbi:MAG: hypothetical protein WCV82_02710 [Candidatus Paceibacterota bacterium]
MPTIVIRDQLVNPPTWLPSFRDLTLYCTIFLKRDVVVEAADPDPYRRWLRSRGCIDFVQDFVRPGSELGVHIDVERRLIARPTFVTDRIVPENMNRIIGFLAPHCDRSHQEVTEFLRRMDL